MIWIPSQEKQPKNDLEKDFFKPMNKSVFGKTMENIWKHRDVKLVTTEMRRWKNLLALFSTIFFILNILIKALLSHKCGINQVFFTKISSICESLRAFCKCKNASNTTQKIRFFFMDFFRIFDVFNGYRNGLPIWWHIPKKLLMKNLTFVQWTSKFVSHLQSLVFGAGCRGLPTMSEEYFQLELKQGKIVQEYNQWVSFFK